MATTIPQFINGSVTFDLVYNRIANYFSQQFKARDIYLDIDRTSGPLISLFVNEQNFKSRINVQNLLLDEVFPGDQSYHAEKGAPGGGASSLGSVIIGQYDRRGGYVRIALRRHGQASAGISNEQELVNNINFYVEGAKDQFGKSNGMTVEFRQKSGPSFVAKNIVKAVGVGSQRKGKEFDERSPELWPKSDVNLIDKDNKEIPISIKQADAEFWASVESWHYPENQSAGIGHGADWYMRTAIEDPKIAVDVDDRGGTGYYTLVHKFSSNADKKVALTWKANKKMRTIAAFGNDIQRKNGCIVRKTFSEKDFNEELDSNNLNRLVVQTDKIITEEKELGDDVYVLCYYTKTRGSQSAYPGVAVKVATKQRAIGSGRNRVLVEQTTTGLKQKVIGNVGIPR